MCDMKRSFFAILMVSLFLAGCAAVQSLVRSTFPYTATVTVPAGGKPGTAQSVTAMASSFDQIFTGQTSNTSAVKDIRLSSVRVDVNSPAGQSLRIFKSIKIYISRGDSYKEHLIAASNDIPSSTASSLLLDADTQTLLDEYIKGSTVRVRLEYELREGLLRDIVLKASLGFDALPATAG